MNECIDAYLNLSQEVFKVDEVLAGHIPVGDDSCRFDYKILEDVIKKLIQEKLGDEDCRMNAVPNTAKHCPTFVVAKTEININDTPTVFRTYRAMQVRPSECALWQAVRATSAAPAFFKPIWIDHPRPAIMYFDGGMEYNNPSQLALNEARRIWPAFTQFGLVSIGTGRPKANANYAIQLYEAADANPDVRRSILQDIKSHLPNIVTTGWDTARDLTPGVKALIRMASALAQLAISSEDVHQRVRRISSSNETEKQFPYFRFNIPRDVGDIGLGDYNNSSEVAAYTQNYMQEDEVEEQKTLCVNFFSSGLSESHDGRASNKQDIRLYNLRNAWSNS